MPRQTEWVDSLVTLDVATGASSAGLDLMAGAPTVANRVRGGTIVRMIYDLNLLSTTTAGAFGVAAIDLAWGIASQEAFAAGALPDPNADERPVRGWLYRTRCVVTQNGIGTQIATPCRGDLRAARKLEDGIMFLTMFSTPNGGTTFNTRLLGIIRTLFLLP